MPTLKRCEETVNEAMTDVDRSVIKRYLRKNCGIIVDDNFECLEDLDVSNPTYLNNSLEFVRSQIGKPDTAIDATDEVNSVYAFEGTEYDNDDVESVYAFDALNENYDSDSGMDIDGEVPHNEVNVVKSVKPTACDAKKAQLKADTNAKTVLRELKNRLDIENWVFIALALVCAFGTVFLLSRNFVLLVLAGVITVISLLSCSLYNDIINDRLLECKKRLNLASTNVNAQTNETVKGDKAN